MYFKIIESMSAAALIKLLVTTSLKGNVCWYEHMPEIKKKDLIKGEKKY